MNATSALIFCLATIASGVISCTIIANLRSKKLISKSLMEMLGLIFFIALFSVPVLGCVFK